jgi:hypothetical protein
VLQRLVESHDAFRDGLDVGSELFGEHTEVAARLRGAFANRDLDLLEPGVMGGKPAIDVIEASVVGGKPAFDVIEASVVGGEPAFDVIETPLDLLEAPVDVIEPTFDVIEAPIDLGEAAADSDEPIVDLHEAGVEGLLQLAEAAVQVVDEILIHVHYCRRRAWASQVYRAEDIVLGRRRARRRARILAYRA